MCIFLAVSEVEERCPGIMSVVPGGMCSSLKDRTIPRHRMFLWPLQESEKYSSYLIGIEIPGSFHN